LDLSDCRALTTIGIRAFAGNSLTSIDLGNCGALTTIGNRAFYENSLTSLDLSDCGALLSIGYEAFSYNPLISLNLSNCETLSEIGERAFYFTSLTSLDFSACGALLSVGYEAFSYNPLTDLDLSNCKTLSEIGGKAFYNNSLKSLDLSECGALTSIGRLAFKGKFLTGFILPKSNTPGYILNWIDGNDRTYTEGNIVDDLVINYTADIVAVYMVHFAVTDGTDAVERATIILNGLKLVTDTNGTAAIEMSNGYYDFTVAAGCFYEVFDSIAVVDQDVFKEIFISPVYYMVTFTVTDGTDPVGGVTIAIGDSVLTAEANSIATIELPCGDYDYTVSADGFEDAEGTISISGANVHERVSLNATEIEEDIAPGIKVYANPATGINVYPNPSSGMLTIEATHLNGVKLMNLQGNVIMKKDIGTSVIRLNTSELSEGLYILQIFMNNGDIHTEKLMIY
jgi:hypothetical protein